MRILFLMACFWMTMSLPSVLAQPTFSFSSHTAEQGETVIVDVSVEDFDMMVLAQFAFSWNSSVLDFIEYTNLSSEAGVSSQVLATPQEIGVPNRGAFAGLAWTELEGLTLADGSVLFSIVFEVIGSECSSSDLAFNPSGSTVPPEVIQLDADLIDMDVTAETTFEDGEVDVPGDDCPEFTELELFGNTVSGENGDEVCIQVGVRGFNDVVAMQYSHNWNTDIIEFSHIQNLNLQNLTMGNFGTGQAENGSLTLSYDGPGGQPISIPDNTIIYEVCFDVTGSTGQFSDFSFTSTPLPIDFIGEVDGVDVELDPIFSSGRVNVVGIFDGLLFTPESAVGAPGDILCLEIEVSGFDNILGFQDLLIEWDPNFMAYYTFSTVDIPSGFDANTLNTDDGRFVGFYFDPDVIGITLPDGAPMIEICFEIIGECETSGTINIKGVGDGPIFAIDGDENEVPAMGESGTVEILCECMIETIVTDASCFGGSDGSIELELSQACFPYDNIVWSGPVEIPEGETNPTGLPAGTYSVTVTYDDGNEVSVLDDIVVGEGDEIVIDNIELNFPTAPDFDNGSIEIEASGGTGELSFDWEPDVGTGSEVTDLTGGIFIVTIADEAGCEFVSEPIILCAPLPAEFEVNDVSCHGENDGSIFVDLIGDASDYSFSWSCDEGNTGLEVEGLGPDSCTLVVEELGTGCVSEYTFEISEPAALEIEEINLVDDDGTGAGEISVVVSGGTSPYTFNWGPGDLPDAAELTDLDGGNYTLVVTDANGCEVDAGTIRLPGALEIGALIQDVACRGEATGSITLMVAGGSGDYDYQWVCTGGESSTSSTISGLSAGTCAVTITDNDSGVEVEEEFVVSEPALDLVLEVMSLECNDYTNQADLDLLATGGVAPYQFSITGNQFQGSNTFFNVPSGDREVFVRDDANCVRSIEISVTDCFDDDCFEGRLVITPNGSGMNDNLIIKCAENTNNKLRIFNRGGQVVFEQSNYRNDWEGTNNRGSTVNEDTYMWVLEVFDNSGGREIHRGTVTVLRDLR
jgi:gliding motility-associated-like protein